VASGCRCSTSNGWRHAPSGAKAHH
jgi:hypothetical protein